MILLLNFSIKLTKSSLRSLRLSSSSKSSSQSSLSSISPITFYYNDVYEQPLSETHKFPMDKYRLVREQLQSQLEPFVKFEISPLATRDELISTHCPIYVDKFLSGNMTEKEIRRTGFPWSKEGVNRAISSVGGTTAATRTVLKDKDMKISAHIAGGTHHAFKNYGEGFCIFSDIAVAANIALNEYEETCKRILIIDLDVHQGNGNAVLFENDPRVLTFSMHCKENYFSEIQFSDVDVEVPANANDDEYCNLLEHYIDIVFEKSKPDLVFFQSGVDIFEHDRLGKLKVTRQGIIRRNRIVFNKIKDSGAKGVIVMGGGYPKNLLLNSIEYREIITCHCDVYTDAYYMFK